MSIYDAFQEVHASAEATLAKAGLTFEDVARGATASIFEEEELEGIRVAVTFDRYVHDKVSKRLAWAYAEQDCPSHRGRAYVRTFNVPDFKPISFVRLGEVIGPTLRVKKYGRRFDIDLDDEEEAVGQLRDRPAAMGRAAARTLGREIAGMLENGSVTYDGLPLFCEEHRNVLTGDTELRADSLLAAISLLCQQTNPNENRIGLRPAVLLVSSELEMLAPTALMEALGGMQDSVVPVVCDWLSGRGWYLFASPDEAPVVGIGLLNGDDQPQVTFADEEQRKQLAEGHIIPATWNVTHCWGTVLCDWRGAVKAPASPPRVSLLRRILSGAKRVLHG